MLELEEIQKRILDLENKKTEIEDLIPWKQNELPKFQKELEVLRGELHELRNTLSTLKNSRREVNENGYAGFF